MTGLSPGSQLGKDEDVRVSDIAMHILEAVEKGEADRIAAVTVED